MDNDSISPQRAKEILSYIQKEVVFVNSELDAERFCNEMAKIFPELKQLASYFQTEKQGKAEKKISTIIEQLSINDNMNAVEAIIAKVEELPQNPQAVLEWILKKFPELSK